MSGAARATDPALSSYRDPVYPAGTAVRVGPLVGGAPARRAGVRGTVKRVEEGADRTGRHAALHTVAFEAGHDGFYLGAELRPAPPCGRGVAR
jgi:hypothetical protein